MASKTMIQPLILFDIDGTIMNGPPLHHDAFSIALREVFGIEASLTELDHHGMTDHAILLALLDRHGVDTKRANIHIAACMATMEDYFASRAPTAAFELLPGVRAGMDRLAGTGLRFGVVTGNLESIARVKLDAVGLGSFFPVGGYGSDDQDRTALVRIALRRAAAHWQQPYEVDSGPTRVWVIGDTVHDIRAGLEAGVRTIGVATGIYSESELRNAGATLTVGALDEQSCEQIVNRVLDAARGATDGERSMIGDE